MNKAFVREPDDTGERNCPACGSLGVPVGRETWQLHVVEAAANALADTAYFCPFARCDVAYFDMFERTVGTGDLQHPVYPKDPQAPICACFGLTAEDVEADIREGGVSRVKALIEKARARRPVASPSRQAVARASATCSGIS